MEPEYVPSELPEPRCPGIVYYEASLRPSCYQLADATHSDSSEMNLCRAGDGQDQPDTSGTFLDCINRYQQVVTMKASDRAITMKASNRATITKASNRALDTGGQRHSREGQEGQ